MEWGRQLVSRGANGRQLTTPFFRKVQKDEIKTNHRRHLGWNSCADKLWKGSRTANTTGRGKTINNIQLWF